MSGSVMSYDFMVHLILSNNWFIWTLSCKKRKGKKHDKDAIDGNSYGRDGNDVGELSNGNGDEDDNVIKMKMILVVVIAMLYRR